MAWGFENEAKLYPCELTGLKFCPSGFAHSYKIMLCWLQGTGDIDCHFKIKKNLENASVSLESTKSPGLFVGLQSDGQVKPVIYTKNGNVFFYPQVIKCTFTLKYSIVFASWWLYILIFSSFFSQQVSAVKLFMVAILEAVKKKKAYNNNHIPQILVFNAWYEDFATSSSFIVF